MLGDGPLMPECRELAKTLGLTGRVLFPGFCQPSEVPSYVAIADLFLLPSSETWGVAALEAASLGVRVVLSDEVGCHADLIQSEQLGVVVSAGSQGALTRAIASQLELPLDPATRAAGAAFMKENFAYDTVAKRLVDSISFRDSVYGQVTEGVVN
jgi:glycosyltransferase involved in cell wall biosynthesis